MIGGLGVSAIMPTVKVNGVRLYYELHGDSGEPLVLIHGYTGDVSDWRYQIAEFARTHRVLAVDLRGHGKSEAPRDRSAYSLLQMSSDVEALIAHIGFRRYHLLGHSMGGAVVQEIALRSPARLLSLTLEDTLCQFGPLGDEPYARWLEDRLKLAEEQGMAAVAEAPAPTPPPPHMSEERLEEMKQRLATMSVDAFVGAWQGILAWPGTRDRAKGIAVPTLVVCGDLDAPVLIAGSKYLAESIPGASLVVMPEAEHAPQYERPELFNAVLRRHLECNADGLAK